MPDGVRIVPAALPNAPKASERASAFAGTEYVLVRGQYRLDRRYARTRHARHEDRRRIAVVGARALMQPGAIEMRPQGILKRAWSARDDTPKHGRWLDMAELELAVLSTQCLDRRIPDKQILTEEVAAWEVSRNKNHARTDWQFTTADVRI
jgi:hypothetical protein